MPEIIEVEMYRRLAERVVGRTIGAITSAAPRYLLGGTHEVLEAERGACIKAARRRGKLLLLDLESDVNRDFTLGLRFGMTGRLVVDGDHAIEELLYTTARFDPAHVRFGIEADRGRLEIVDPRRFGNVEVDPDEDVLGVDAWTVSASALGAAVRGGRSALKGRLLDQSRVAGLGNLLCDETLWRVGIDPTRPAGSLTDDDVESLAHMIRSTIAELDRRGGSHLGDLQDQRHPDGVCPRDGERLRHATVGGRSTYWCPRHQG